MSSTLDRIKKDIQELAGADDLARRITALENERRILKDEVKGLRKALAEMSKKVAALTGETPRQRGAQLVDIIEEKMKTMPQPVKIVDLRKELMDDDRVTSRAGNFYSVIVTAMNNSPKFEKLSSGVYRLTTLQ
ncbi:MAG TPA: hypothetical protein PLQ76_00215 [bacterium]|nr:hypothetical protein [bacterium]